MKCPCCDGLGETTLGGYPLWSGLQFETLVGPEVTITCGVCKGLGTVDDAVGTEYIEEKRKIDAFFWHIWIPALGALAIILLIAAVVFT